MPLSKLFFASAITVAIAQALSVTGLPLLLAQTHESSPAIESPHLKNHLERQLSLAQVHSRTKLA